MARRTTLPELTPDQQAESDRILAALRRAAESDLRELANLLATKDDASTLGATEFAVRDLVLGIGAKALEAALEGRKKGGTRGPAGRARDAARRPGSSGGGPARS